MTTSGSTSFTQTKQQIVRKAFGLIGKYAQGKSPSVEDFNLASDELNCMLAEWAASPNGPHLWTKEEGMLFLQQYVGEYSLNNASTDAYFALRSDTVTTTLSAAAAASATSLTVTSTTGMAVSDNIGVVLDDGSTHWTTIATIPGATSLTITTGLASAASSSNLVYTFTSRAVKPLRIHDIRLIQGFDSGSSSTQTELAMTSMSYEEYWQMSKTTLNDQHPNQYHYNPRVDNGKLYIWPRPTNTSYRLQISYQRQIEDMVGLGDTFDLPKEWLSPIHWQLAVRIAPIFGAENKLGTIGPIAERMLDNALDWDREHTSIYFQPDQGYYY